MMPNWQSSKSYTVSLLTLLECPPPLSSYLFQSKCLLNAISHSRVFPLSPLLDKGSQEGVAVAKRTLVGRIVAEKTLNRNVVKEIVSKAWDVKDEVKISDLGPNIYLFTFSEVEKVKKVLEEGPWFIMGHLLSVQYWIPEVSVFEINFDHVYFWVQLHRLPLEYMTVNNARKVAQKIGTVHSIEDPFVEGQLRRPFFRVRVKVNIKKPLLTGFWVPRKDLPRTWIFIKYERLQDYCYNCGILGHDYRRCKKEKEMTVHIQNRPRYGPNLAVQQAKSMAAIVSENVNRARKLNEGEEGDVAEKDKNGGHSAHMATKGTENDLHAEGYDCDRGKGKAAEDQVAEICQPPSSEVSGGQDKAMGHKTYTVVELCNVEEREKEEYEPCTAGKSPTVMDLNQGKVRAGLGPTNYQDMDLVQEDIGLKEKCITWDMRSPTREGSSSYGVSLSLGEINFSIYSRIPPEEVDDEAMTVAVCRPEVEGQLVQGFKNMVTLKRQRSIPELEYCSPLEGEGGTALKKCRHDTRQVTDSSKSDVPTLMVEEAGLIKPPPQP
ncbi:Zinc finger, CCHC-type [Sesbania bispinosa]|nr:Zinc finger, CCHC-type [Sesbania bispinosa]